MTTRFELPPGKNVRRLPIAADGPSSPGSSVCTDVEPLRVGELAKRTGKTVRALHLYEEIGLLEPARRTDAGYRLYSSDSVTRVEWITRLQDAGLSLPEIRDLLASWGSSGSAPGAMKKVTEVFEQKLDETRAQIARLRELERELVRSLDYLATCDSCEPQRVVHECPSCDRHDCDTHPPVLVAGFHPTASDGAE
ncbi:MerR family transcriptional regulator [Sandaracinus amylolyticus]|uniref:MerR family transcriptional regulator n=1 Tax=Sandaracinus amylolyticus TaxID=927083 RepID=UPI001F02D1FA|nr:MerR family transcriptional regulator [Sandaracinus amylolyticus]UJR79833.1 Transcriptional activator TipA [Sandaracinus amylolyticus]